MAQIYMTREEFSWMERWLRIRPSLEPSDDRFLTTGSPTNGKALLTYLQMAWAEMGLPGKPTFTDIRTSIATHARNSHSPDIRHRVARFMCHDTSTSDRFYSLKLTLDQCRAMRELFEQASRPARESTEAGSQ